MRNIENSDTELIHKLRSDETANAFIGRENSSTLEKAQEFILKIQHLVQKNEGLYWIIRLKENNNLMGSVCLFNLDIENESVEIGYEMLPEFQGKGFMGEALKKVIAYTFEEIKAKKITACLTSDNIRSITILEKMNFKIEVKEHNNTHDNIKNLLTYTLKNSKVNQ
ncbi:hypothetical protein AR687_08115 [Flavobacteriaceae bacterium CRH]|nr:hypothetical protein AR687_08115 [Flavobacteriaceae bacterium CRH]